MAQLVELGAGLSEKQWLSIDTRFIASKKNLFFFRFYKRYARKKRPVSLAVRTLLSAREVLGLNPGSSKSDTVSSTARHRCDISSELCDPGIKSGGNGPRHSLHASA